MNSSQKKAVVDSFIDAYNRFDVDGMVTLLHPNCRFWNVSEGQVNASADGIEEFQALAEQSAQLFSRRRQTVTSYQEEDTIRVDVDYEGVLAANLPEGPRSGEVMRLQGRSVYEVRDGLIYRLMHYS